MNEWHATPGSSNVKGFGYDGTLLTVEFKDGRRYTGRVSQSEYEALARADSVGSHISKHFKTVLVAE